jgi:signal transduction histidine kinase
MGYRSDVGFACDPIIKQVIETVSEWDKELRELIAYADDMSSDDYGLEVRIRQVVRKLSRRTNHRKHYDDV